MHSENEHPAKRLQEDLLSMGESSQPLSKANLKEHDRLTEPGTPNEMTFGVGTSEISGRKRPLSRSASSADMN